MDETYNLQFATTQLDLRQYERYTYTSLLGTLYELLNKSQYQAYTSFIPAKNQPWTQYQDQTGMKVVKSTEYQYQPGMKKELKICKS
jgi:hypothetical protein